MVFGAPRSIQASSTTTAARSARRMAWTYISAWASAALRTWHWRRGPWPDLLHRAPPAPVPGRRTGPQVYVLDAWGVEPKPVPGEPPWRLTGQGSRAQGACFCWPGSATGPSRPGLEAVSTRPGGSTKDCDSSLMTTVSTGIRVREPSSFSLLTQEGHIPRFSDVRSSCTN